MLHFRPHRACLDGEEDGGLKVKYGCFCDPIQLAWMVKEIRELWVAEEHLIHHPGKLDGAFECVFAWFF
jgi:hypothetical protein